MSELYRVKFISNVTTCGDDAASSFAGTAGGKAGNSVVEAGLAVGPAEVPGALGEAVELGVGPAEVPDGVEAPRARGGGPRGQPAQKPVDAGVEFGGIGDGLHVQQREAVGGVDSAEEALVGVFEEAVVVPDGRSFCGRARRSQLFPCRGNAGCAGFSRGVAAAQRHPVDQPSARGQGEPGRRSFDRQSRQESGQGRPERRLRRVILLSEADVEKQRARCGFRAGGRE